jgi:polyisoprenyl-phosphate glycosyltransferase
MKISLASPVYNDSPKIQEFIHRSIKVLKSISNDVEVVLVNDCSTDDSLTKIKELITQYSCIKLINLTVNSGQHLATSIALKHTTGDYIFMMDSDLQVDPENMLSFYEESKNKNWDIISANRISRSNNFSRKLGSKVISFLLQKIGKNKFRDIGSTFKLIKRPVLDKLLSQDILIQNLPILIMNLNLKIIEYDIQYNNKQERGSHYNYKDLVFAIILALLNFSTGSTMLIILIFLGGFCSVLGIGAVLAIIIWGIINQSELPLTIFLFSLVVSIIGLQFFLISMVVFKLERINKNLDFRKAINQRIEYED